MFNRPDRGPAEKFAVFLNIAYGPFDSGAEAYAWAERHFKGRPYEVHGLHDPAKAPQPAAQA